MSFDPNRREFSRAAIRIVATFRHEGGQASGTTRDVSLAGAFIRTPSPPECGVRGHTVLALGEEQSAPRLEVPARVVRSADDGFALEFDELEIEAYHHLRAVVLLNAADPEGVEREIGSHLGIRRSRPVD